MDKDLLYRFFERRASIEEMKEIKQWSELSDANRDLLYKERKLFDAMQVLASPNPDKKKTTSPRRSIHKFLYFRSKYIRRLKIFQGSDSG